MKLIDDIGLGLTLASDIPAAVTLLETELPTVEGEVKTAYEAVLTPAKAIAADVSLTVKGGSAAVVTQAGEQTVADISAFIAAVEALIPTVEGEAKAEYAKILPVLQPIATALKINLPTIQATAAASAAAA